MQQTQLISRSRRSKQGTAKMSHGKIVHKMKHCSLKSHHQRYQQNYSSHISYISKEVLSDRILNAHLPTIIIDTRDDDVVGGMIQGALFCPESSFTRKTMLSLLEKAKEKRLERNSGITEHKTWVVFHCMETVMRSVRCAKRFNNLVREAGDSDIISVKLLTGGADGWIRSFWNNKRLVEGFDDKYWGFEEDQKQLDSAQIKDNTQPRLENDQKQIEKTQQKGLR
jgi:3-mercaptopyruvate sulfurtransferase SseA